MDQEQLLNFWDYICMNNIANRGDYSQEEQAEIIEDFLNNQS